MAEDRKFKFENGQFVNRVSGEAIPDDEPVIIFRARDKHALSVLNHYHDLVSDDYHAQAVLDRINEFREFRVSHPARVKEPGITRAITLNVRDKPGKLPKTLIDRLIERDPRAFLLYAWVGGGLAFGLAVILVAGVVS